MTTPDSLPKPYTPQRVTDVLLAFPGSVRHLMPSLADLEADQIDPSWERFAHDVFFGKLPADTDLHVREGVDVQVAGRHLRCILGSFEPKHEHKTAAVAILAATWFERVTAADGTVLYGKAEQ